MDKAKVYTQVIASLPVLELPHPNPPLIKGRELDFPVSPFAKGRELDFPVSPLAKGRELDFPVSPLYKGGLRGVKPGSQSNSDLCVHLSHALGRGE